MGSTTPTFDPCCLPVLLPNYYKKLFPCRTLLSWLRYGNSEYFSKREFAFILADDVYLRYRSYNDALEFEKDLYNTVPEKIDIGAVYNLRPKSDRYRRGLCAMERELVFDIDLTDYDDVRSCCKGANVCKKCWTFMVVAVLIIDAALKDDFGFHERLWVFSGRRGVHCWVSDEIARKLNQSARTAIVEYLSVSSGGEKTKTVEFKGSCLHTSLKRASLILRRFFPKLVSQQGWLDTEEDVQKLIGLISDTGLRKYVKENMSGETGYQRWKYLIGVCQEQPELTKSNPFFIEEIMFQYAYPRLDANVSTGVNHLLKAPFCIHAKTGKVCVPFEPIEALLLKFDPDNVPRIDMLHNELMITTNDQSIIESVEQETVHRKPLDYKRTSLKPFIELFETFVKNNQKISQASNNNVDMDF